MVFTAPAYEAGDPDGSPGANGAVQVAVPVVPCAVARVAAASPQPRGGNGPNYGNVTVTVASSDFVNALSSSSTMLPVTVSVCGEVLILPTNEQV